MLILQWRIQNFILCSSKFSEIYDGYYNDKHNLSLEKLKYIG